MTNSLWQNINMTCYDKFIKNAIIFKGITNIHQTTQKSKNATMAQ